MDYTYEILENKTSRETPIIGRNNFDLSVVPGIVSELRVYREGRYPILNWFVLKFRRKLILMDINHHFLTFLE